MNNIEVHSHLSKPVNAKPLRDTEWRSQITSRITTEISLERIMRLRFLHLRIALVALSCLAWTPQDHSAAAQTSVTSPAAAAQKKTAASRQKKPAAQPGTNVNESQPGSTSAQPATLRLSASPNPAKVGAKVVFTVTLGNRGAAPQLNGRSASQTPRIEYRFAFGDGSASDWLSTTRNEHTYTFAGIFLAHAEARLANGQAGARTVKSNTLLIILRPADKTGPTGNPSPSPSPSVRPSPSPRPTVKPSPSRVRLPGTLPNHRRHRVHLPNPQ
jgi:hypothetical protein